MLCSKCSALVRPVVAVDIDGTLGDYHTHFIEFAVEWLGAQVSSDVYKYGGVPRHREWFCKTFGVDVSTFRAIKLAYRQGGHKRTMPVWQGSKDFLEAIVRSGAELWLTTTRPHDRYDRVDPDTREWLRRHGLPFHGLLYDEDKMDALHERVAASRVVAVVDDEPEPLSRAEELFGHNVPILRRTPYNRGIEAYSIADTIMDARKMVYQRIEHFGRVYG